MTTDTQEDTLFGDEDENQQDLEERVEELQQQIYDQNNTQTETYINFVEQSDGSMSLKVTTETVRWFPMEYVKKAQQNPNGGGQ